MNTVTELTKPKHGQQRNWCIEKTGGVKNTLVDTSGAEHEFVLRGEQSASERFCATCDKWVTAVGVLGGVWCPTCQTDWRKN